MFKRQQSKFIHMQANKGVPWAKKFVADSSHAKGSVKKLPQKRVIKKLSGNNPLGVRTAK